MTIDYAARARALVGTRFRPQGRSEGGLDCIGVLLITFGIAPQLIRRDYKLKGRDHLAAVRAGLEDYFRRVPRTQLRTGDVMLFEAGKQRPHLAVRTASGFVHAHAGVGRVVETPGDSEWPLLGVYRKRRGR